MPDSFLTAAPFNLSPADIAWVRQTMAALSDAARVAQLFVLPVFGDDPGTLARLAKLQPGGITRFFGPDRDYEIDFLESFRQMSNVPPTISADLEGSRMSLPFGTSVANPLALAAIDDEAATREVVRIMAEEAVALGVNWSFTPVLDINHAFRSPIVATRGFGSDLETIKRHALAQIEVLQAHGIAAAVKHWPGEGYDDRDQHLVTTINPLCIEEWEATFGTLYRAAVKAGAMSVMSAHIAFPAFVRSLNPNAGIEAFRPASLSRLLNIDLLRNRLGFNGLIVSDASEMAGLTAWADERVSKAQIIANGCDVILFTREPETDMAAVLAAIQTGDITRDRFEEAVLRVLGMKAALGLHRQTAIPAAKRKSQLAKASNQTIARAITARAPTLVKDVKSLSSITLARHRRVLIFTTGIVSPIHPFPINFILPDLLAAEGFVVSIHTPETQVSPANFDLVLYLFGEETLLTRGRIFLDWAKIAGNFVGAMQRYWHNIPTIMVSFGYPYYLYDAPRAPTYINAYCTTDDMQKAVLECLMGRSPWNTHNPVDPFCGLEDAHY